MDSVSNWIKCKSRGIHSCEKIAFLCACIFGLIVHISALSNSFIYHDAADVEMRNQSTSSLLPSGRWCLAILFRLSDVLGIYAGSATFHGIMAILIIAIASALIVRFLSIENKVCAALIGCIMVSFPTVTSTFAYMWTAPYYLLSVLMGAYALNLVIKHQNSSGRGPWAEVVLAALIISCAMGIYQTAICMVIALVFSYAVIQLAYGKDELKVSGRKICILVLACLFGTLIYLMISKLCLFAFGLAVTNYQGMSHLGELDFSALPAALFDCYEKFITMQWDYGSSKVGLNNSCALRILLLGVSIACFAFLCCDTCKRCGKRTGIQFTLLVVFLTPLAMNSIAIMSFIPDFNLHTLMVYSLAIYFVFLLAILSHSNMLQSVKSDKKRLVISGTLSLCLALFPLSYFYTASVAYYRMQLIQIEMESWFTTLVTRIKSCEGFRDDLEVAFIGARHISDNTIYSYRLYGADVMGYSFDVPFLINEYAWLKNLWIHTGYRPQVADNNAVYYLESLHEVEDMPSYPDDGSIRVIDDIVVVKLS